MQIFALRMVLFAVALQLGACASTPPAQQEITAIREQPGADRWLGDALYLPANSPIVLSARPQALIRGLVELTDWASDTALYADRIKPDFPLLFLLQRALGEDVTRNEAWARYGLDTSRSIYLGVGAASAENRRYVQEVEDALASKMGAGSTPLLDLLTPTAHAPGLHAEVARRTAGLQPYSAARMVLPALDPSVLLNFIDRHALTFGWERVPTEEAAPLKMGILGRAYVHPDLDMPSFSLRILNDVVLVDGVMLGPSQLSNLPAEWRQSQLTTLKNWLQSNDSKAGRPVAPRIVADTDLSIGLDTLETARLVRLRGFQRALGLVSRVDARKRDDMLLFRLRETLMSARAWELRAHELPGVAYSLTVGEPDSTDAFDFEMTMFTSSTAERVTAPTSEIGFGVSDRGLAASFSLAPFNDDAWRKLVTIDDPAQTLDILDAGEDEPVLFSLALPRLIAVILGNLVSAGPNSLNPISEIVNAVPSLERVDFAWVGDPLAPQRRLLLVATFSPGVTAGERDAAAARLAGFAAMLAGYERSPEPVWIGTAATPIGLVGTSGHAIMTSQFVLFGIGLQAEELEEVRAAMFGAHGKYPVHFRAEPSTWIPMLSQYPIQWLMKFDPATLAQRLGPVEVFMAPEVDGKTQSLRWRIQWKRPPRL